MHTKNVGDRKDTIKNLKRTIRKKEKENNKLDAELEEIALSVAERRNVNDANGKTGGEKSVHRQSQHLRVQIDRDRRARAETLTDRNGRTDGQTERQREVHG